MISVEEVLPPAHRGFFGFFWSMIWKPSGALRAISLQKDRKWLAMALITTLCAILPVVIAGPIATRQVQEALRTRIDNGSNQGPRLSEEGEQQAIRSASNPLLITIFPAIGRIVSLWIGWLIWAGGLNILSTLAGGSSSFSQFWRTVVWCWLPFALRGLLQAVFILVSGELIVYPGLSGLVARAQSAPDLLVTPPSAGQIALKTLLSQVDLFQLWNLGLLVAGVMVTARLSHRKAILVTLSLWLVLVLFGLIPGLLAGVFQS